MLHCIGICFWICLCTFIQYIYQRQLLNIHWSLESSRDRNWSTGTLQGSRKQQYLVYDVILLLWLNVFVDARYADVEAISVQQSTLKERIAWLAINYIAFAVHICVRACVCCTSLNCVYHTDFIFKAIYHFSVFHHRICQKTRSSVYVSALEKSGNISLQPNSIFIRCQIVRLLIQDMRQFFFVLTAACSWHLPLTASFLFCMDIVVCANKYNK